MAGSFPRRFWPSSRPPGPGGAATGAARFGLVAAAALLLGACSSTNSGLALPRAGGPIPVSAAHEPTAAEKAYWDQLAPARVIYIAETHSSNSDHEYQLDVLKGLKARGTDFTVAWEMFDFSQQPALDAWGAHRISTENLLQQTDFQQHWGTFSVMYEKILRWTQAEGIASLALNAPAILSHKLALGLPLTAEERAELPGGFHPLNGGFEHFAEQMAQNPHPGANPENFYKAQLLWDQTMASRIVEFIDSHPASKLVVLIGRGHVDGGFGVPAFVSQKTGAAQLVVYPQGVQKERPAGTIATIFIEPSPQFRASRP